MKKERLDVLLCSLGYAESREKAKRTIMAGLVYVDGNKEDKAGATFPETAKIEVRGAALPYVSRGGLKLEKAIRTFGVSPTGKVCMDVGASTGGFTDCMLQNGAVKVYAIDVGHGQLDWKLRNDERVVCMEKTNIRYVTPDMIAERAALVSIDVSFISLTKVLPAVHALMAEGGELVCLIKPQFEAGREQVGKKGVVRDKKVHLEVIERTLGFALGNGFSVLGLTFSPIKGPEGNIEYLAWLRREALSSEEAAATDTEASSEPTAEADGALLDTDMQDTGLLEAEKVQNVLDMQVLPNALRERAAAVVAESHSTLDL